MSEEIHEARYHEGGQVLLQGPNPGVVAGVHVQLQSQGLRSRGLHQRIQDQPYTSRRADKAEKNKI